MCAQGYAWNGTRCGIKIKKNMYFLLLMMNIFIKQHARMVGSVIKDNVTIFQLLKQVGLQQIALVRV